MRLDLIEALQDYLNSQNLFSNTVIGTLLKENESISVFPLPSSDQPQRFYDGSKDATYYYQINLKSNSQETLINASYNLDNSLIELSSLTSINGSFDFLDSRITSQPSLVAEEEQGYYIYSLTVAIDIHIRRGVI